MASEIEICNLALSYLGQAPITNLLSPQNATEQLCAINYPFSRDAILESHDWSFAVARLALTTPDPSTPNWGFNYQFQLPTDVLRVIWCGDNQNEKEYAQFDWRVEQRFIVTDANPVWIRYVRKVTDTTQYSPLFVQALACRLAMEMCVSITENVALYQRLTAMYGIKLSEAVANDGMQGRSEKIKQNVLSSAR